MTDPKMTKTTPPPAETAFEPFVVIDEVAVPLAVAWAAHTQIDQVTQWFGSAGTEVVHAEMDLREGGSFHYCLRTSEGDEMWGKQRYLEVVPLQKLVFLQSFSDKDGAVKRHPAATTWPLETLAVTTFEDVDGETTKLTVSWAPHNASAEEQSTFEQAREGMAHGFDGMFDRLEDFLFGDEDD